MAAVLWVSSLSLDLSQREFSASDGPVNWLLFNRLPDASQLPGCNTPFSARVYDGPVRGPAPTTKNAVCRRGGFPYPPEVTTDCRIGQHQRKRTTGRDSSANHNSGDALVRNAG